MPGGDTGLDEDKLKLHPDKREVLLVTSNLTLDSGVTPVLDGVAALPLKAQDCSEGVLLHPLLLLDT